MATSFKTLQASDIQASRTKLHEAIPITGTIVSGTYLVANASTNVKNFSHGMFQSVFDYPFLSSSANHIFDITVGLSANSSLSASTNVQGKQKLQLYNQMAQVLVGHDATGSIREFDKDGDLTSGEKFHDALFFNFSRLLVKDEIQKGTFRMEFSVDPTGAYDQVARTTRVIKIEDQSGSNSFKTNSPAGEYGILFVTSSTSGTLNTNLPNNSGLPCGLLFYQAGIAVLTSSLFKVHASGGLLGNELYGWGGNLAGNTGGKVVMDSASHRNIDEVLTLNSISGTANDLRNRLQDIYFANTTELNSTIYFCRANASDFNYSSNPTYLSKSQIRVKETREDSPVSYITTVGLYGANNELLAVAKLSEPLKKTPSNEFTLRVRLDY
jgi:hypothetical protein